MENSLSLQKKINVRTILVLIITLVLEVEKLTGRPLTCRLGTTL